MTPNEIINTFIKAGRLPDGIEKKKLLGLLAAVGTMLHPPHKKEEEKFAKKARNTREFQIGYLLGVDTVLQTRLLPSIITDDELLDRILKAIVVVCYDESERVGQGK